MSTVREALPSDVPTVLALVRELADYEHELAAVTATEELFHEALFAEGHVAHCLLVEDGVEVAGIALYYLNFSTWWGRPGIYLDDLFVREAFRGRGHGKRLIRALAALCVERDYARLEWTVLDWNEPSIAFYRSLGARPMDEWTTYRLSGEALAAAAG